MNAMTSYLFSFDEESLSSEVVLQELTLGLFFLVPLGTCIGHITMRLACKCSAEGSPKRFVAGVVALWLMIGVQCRVLDNMGDTLTVLGWLSRTFGWTYHSPKEGALVAMAQLLVLRVVLLSLGAYIGESFRPIALTGGIACGKTTVADLLKNSSVVLVDTDTIAHEILLPPSQSGSDSVYFQIMKTFGTDILVDNDSSAEPLIDRRKLGAIIFGDETKRRALNAITHPRIIMVMLKRILRRSFSNGNTIVCADVPLLFESGMLRLIFSLVIVVACSPKVQLQRLHSRNADLTKKQCKERIDSQLDIEKKIQKADFVVRNEGSLKDLEKAVNNVLAEVQDKLFGHRLLASQMVMLTILVAALNWTSIAI